ncbi:hypothetical protein B484DRAFT_440063, partial [Ochromonadaceae sp. CCMP2298]
LSGDNMRELAALDNCIFVDPRTGLAYAISASLPCDMSAIWTFCGIGGPGHNCQHFCCFCSCQGDHRGMRSYELCADCSRDALILPEDERPRSCYHTDFVDGAAHAAALPTQLARDASGLRCQAAKQLEVDTKTVSVALGRLRIDAKNCAKACQRLFDQALPKAQQAPAAQAFAAAALNCEVVGTQSVAASALALAAVDHERRSTCTGQSTAADLLACRTLASTRTAEAGVSAALLSTSSA